MKKVWGSLLVACMLLLSVTAFLRLGEVKANPVTWTVATSGSADFHSIQAAVNSANAGDTIVVKSGTYLETVTIGKSLTLVGNGPGKTFIEGTSSAGAVTINSGNIGIFNFSISNVPQIMSPAVTISGVSGVTVANNTISGSQTGIAFTSASNNIVANNTLISDGYAVSLDMSSYGNTFYQNNITENTIGVYLFLSYNNTFYHNTFSKNTMQVLLIGQQSNNWDEGYPDGGNYWSDYTGVDLNMGINQNIPTSDGIGDTPYTIGTNNVDNYPLMRPYHYIPGDLNKDGVVDFKDLVYFVNGYISYWSTFTIKPEYKVCDLNNDGRIDIIDLVIFASDYIMYQESTQH